MATNPYNAPRARVADAAEQVGEAKFWSFAGRIGRMRYIAYNMAATLVMMAVLVGVMIIGGGAAAMGADEAGGMVIILLIIPIYIVAIVISFMLSIQRVHDFNMSGWLSLLTLFGAAIVFMFIPGTKGSNNYGPQPPPNSAGVLVLFWMFVAGLIMLPILAAISIPAYMQYMQQAQESQMEQGGQMDQQEFQRQMEQLQQQMLEEQQQQEAQPQQ